MANSHMTFGVDLLPKTTNTYSLGNSSQKWKIYADSIDASSLSGDGSGLTNLNASNISSGTLAAARLTNNYGDTKNPYASKTKNYVLAAPSNADGAPSFRALVAADIPNLSWNKITSDKPTTLSGYGITDAVKTTTSTDNTIVRFDGTSGAIQNSSIKIDDNGHIIVGAAQSIYQNQADTSNYAAIITWLKNSKGWIKEGTTYYTYQPQIGQHNTGGDGTGSITILPYPTDTAPWNGSVGLFIRKGQISLDNNRIPHTGNTTGSVGRTTTPVYVDEGVIKPVTLKDTANALINALDTGSSDLTANDYVITQYVGGGTTTTTYHRRPASKVVNATLVKAALGTVSTTAKKFLKDTGSWVQVDWEDLTGKPTSFTPSTHTHDTINCPSITTEADIASGTRSYQGSGSGWTGSITSMTYAGILQVCGGYSRGWQIWAQRGNNATESLHWRNPNGAATAWNEERIILDSGNTTKPSSVPTLSWNTESTVFTLNGSAVKIKAMVKPTYAFTDLTSHPTTLSDYGITDAAPINSPTFTGTPKSETPTSTSDAKMIATKEYVDGILAANDALVYKGTKAGASTATNGGTLMPAGVQGDTYKVSTAGYINGVYCEVGDMIICVTDVVASTSSNYSTTIASWNIIQTSDGTVSTSETSVTENTIPRYSGTTGKFIKSTGVSIDNNNNILTKGNLTLNSASGNSPALLFTRDNSLTDWKIFVSSGRLLFCSATDASTWSERGYFSDNSGNFTVTGTMTATDFYGGGANITLGTANVAVVTDDNKKLSTRSITNNTSNTAIANNTNFPTMNTIYYGLVTVNNASQTRATGIYAPTSAGTTDHVLISRGGNNAPVWTASATLASATSTTANTAAYDILTLGNSANVSTTTAHSEGKIVLYSAATAAHTIVGQSTTTAHTHTLPNTDGTLLDSENYSTYLTGTYGIEIIRLTI